MDFVKREDQNSLEHEYNKIYSDTVQKAHLLDSSEYQHTPISMEQLHQAMQSSVANSIVHNFQLPLSPRQMSTLMFKTNHLNRNMNFNDIPAHLTRNLTAELETHSVINELPQNLNRHDDLLSRIDASFVRSLGQDLELQSIVQNLSEHSLSTDLSRINELRSDMANDLSHEINLSNQLNRQNIEQEILHHEERRLAAHCVQDNHLLDQNLGQRLVATSLNLNERHLDPQHLMPVQFHIKSEQEDDGYLYENINQGANISDLNGLSAEHTQSQTNVHTDNQLYTAVYSNQANVPALNPIDLYSRQQNYAQNFTNIRENPQNLVVHRQFNNASSYQTEFKKIRQDGAENTSKEKTEDPKENLKPADQNKIYYVEYQNFNESKNENDSNVQNKMNDDITMNIKGQFVCYKCNDVFTSKRGLKQHSKSCNETEEPVEKVGKFMCNHCSYRCQSPAILKIHERTHSGEKPFSCTFCDYKSGQKNNVAKHILVHMKEKPFRCQYCDYRCAQKNNLVVHERTHTGYKPFACPYCDYRTVQKPNLVKHMYLHTDQKPFSCDMCSYRCVQKTNLTKHKQRHLHDKDGDKVEVKIQVKPYRPRQKSVKCDQCPYRCVQKSSLDKHIQFKHCNEIRNSNEVISGNEVVTGCELVNGNAFVSTNEVVSGNEITNFDQGLNLMKNNLEETIQNLSVKKDQYDCHVKINQVNIST